MAFIYLFAPRGERDQPALETDATAAPEEPLNINTASIQELESLPGLGPVAAQHIVEYRERHGLFHQPSDLLIIEGIGEKKYRVLANLIRVE